MNPTDAGTQPRGKQVSSPRTIWYTAVTGIWQTVWIEPVPEAGIRSVSIVPVLGGDDGSSVALVVATSAPVSSVILARATAPGRRTEVASGTVSDEGVATFSLPVPNRSCLAASRYPQRPKHDQKVEVSSRRFESAARPEV